MGMDYQYAGSASYPRFDEELCAVAKIFGGVETKHLKEKREVAPEGTLNYWFGFYSSDNSDKAKFVFPEGTDEILVKWFNNIYEEFTEEETLRVWSHIKKHPEIMDISAQIWDELYFITKYGEGWYLSY